ncbi:hypothetical protein OIU78_020095, partial [Salix suchowensis]
MDYLGSTRKSSCAGKIIASALCITVCITILEQRQSSSYSNLSSFSQHELGVTHVLVTGGAGYIGSHAALRLLKDSYRVTIVDNLSRGNLGAVKVLQDLFPEPGRLQFIYARLGRCKSRKQNLCLKNAFDAVMHFASIAYVGESTTEPLRYTWNAH